MYENAVVVRYGGYPQVQKNNDKNPPKGAFSEYALLIGVDEGIRSWAEQKDRAVRPGTSNVLALFGAP